MFTGIVSWSNFKINMGKVKFGGQPGSQQLAFYNLKEIPNKDLESRNLLG